MRLRGMRYMTLVLIGILLIIPAIHAEENIEPQGGPGDNLSQRAEVQPSVTNEDLMPTPPLRITISGRVTDLNGRPLEGATVRTEFFMTYDVQSVVVTSGTDGSYRINNAHGFRQNISVEKTGYISVSKEIVFDQNVNTADFTLTPVPQPTPGFTGISGLIALAGVILIMVFRKRGNS